ncbi:hypothetical protein XENOCAPTIV_024354 [Xenoophorus captivus]|uniref:Uncharacterized protein n=1 Tax=Xenoophorus captivus TaxID=1517983 RepID=A0ABV0QBC3_9TELE
MRRSELELGQDISWPGGKGVWQSLLSHLKDSSLGSGSLYSLHSQWQEGLLGFPVSPRERMASFTKHLLSSVCFPRSAATLFWADTVGPGCFLGALREKTATTVCWKIWLLEAASPHTEMWWFAREFLATQCPGSLLPFCRHRAGPLQSALGSRCNWINLRQASLVRLPVPMRFKGQPFTVLAGSRCWLDSVHGDNEYKFQDFVSSVKRAASMVNICSAAVWR